MNSRIHILICMAGAIAFNGLPVFAQATYTPFNSNTTEVQDPQLRGSGDSLPYQNTDAPPTVPSTEQGNTPPVADKKKRHHKDPEGAKTKSDKSAIDTVAGAPTKAAKTGVGLTDRTAKASLGLTDRAAKTGVGMPAKALKETFKAIF